MSFDDAFEALSNDALKFVKDGFVIGLGSGRAASVFVKILSNHIKKNRYQIKGIPTSLQIKLVAENLGLPLVEIDQIDHIDVVFDGADQINSQGYVIKGGGGALLRENILFSMAKKIVIIGDKSKFVKNFSCAVPIEIHPLARKSVSSAIRKLGGDVKLRLLDRGYPFFTENGNLILDCKFGVITNPKILSQKIIQISGVMESGIFLRKPDIIYKAKIGSKFEIVK